MREKRGTSRWKRHKGTTRLVLKHASPLNNALAAIYPNITRGKQALNPLPHLCFHTSLARIWTKTLIPFQHLRKDTKIKQGDIKHTNEKRNAKRREESGGGRLLPPSSVNNAGDAARQGATPQSIPPTAGQTPSPATRERCRRIAPPRSVMPPPTGSRRGCHDEPKASHAPRCPHPP